ncbi:protein, Rhodopirellula transposase family, partial [Candidatus Magnetobacterium bavaricum]
MENNTEFVIQRKFEVLKDVLDEQSRRLWAAVEAEALGRGGITSVSKATGLSRTTIYEGIRRIAELKEKPSKGKKRIRLPGGGRKPVVKADPSVLVDIERLVDPVTRGDPQSPLRWTCKSVRHLAVA